MGCVGGKSASLAVIFTPESLAIIAVILANTLISWGVTTLPTSV